jgi:hypothetical protein
MARGQFMMEFMILLSVGVLLGMTYIAVTSELFASTSERQRVTALNEVGYMVQDELMLAESVEDGYQRNFTIPSMADRFAYSMTNTATSLTLSSGSSSITYPLPRVSGTLQTGRNIILRNGNISVVPG